METSVITFTAMLPVFLIIGAGYLARRIGWLNEEADRSLMRVVVNLLYPALIFDFILGNPALRQTENLILPPLIGLTTVMGGFGIAMLAARRLRLGDSRECRTFGFTTGLYNYGYFPIPIIAALFDRETAGVLLVHNLGVEVAMWALGVGFILSPDDPKSVWRRIFSGPVIAILAAVPLNLMGAGERAPNAVLETIDMLGGCAIPVALLLIGATFADLAKGLRFRARPAVAGTACALRMGVLPLLFLLVAAVFQFSRELKQVMLVQAAMPCAVLPVVLARHFDGSPEIALRVVLSTTLLSLATIPVWIGLGFWILRL